MAKSVPNARPATPPDPEIKHDIDPENMGEHEGATEEEVAPVPPPADPEFDDEPRQG